MSVFQWIAIAFCVVLFLWIKWGEAWANKKLRVSEWTQEKVDSTGTALAVAMLIMVGYSVVILIHSVWVDMGFGDWLWSIDWKTFSVRLALTCGVFLLVSLGGGIKAIKFVMSDTLGRMDDGVATFITWWWVAVMVSVLYISAVLVYHIWG